MNQAKISAIIPTFNCDRYIAEALESVFHQSYPPEEVIVVDDGSTDGTREALKPYQHAIIYVHQKNAGEPAARNTGIRHASGEFIAFLDADDLWLPEKLELQMDYLEKCAEVDLVYSDMKMFDEHGIVHESVTEWRKLSPPSGHIFPQLFAEPYFCPGAVVFRKACIEKVGPFDETFFVGCDYEMWLRMARHFQFGYLDKPLLMYRQHPAMATRGLGRVLQNGLPWEAKVITKILGLYPDVVQELGRSAVRRRLARPYYYLGCGCLDRHGHSEARKMFSRALWHWPWSWRCGLRYFATFLTPALLSRIKNLYHRFSRENPTNAESITPVGDVKA